jgi:hypothetical protein
MQTDTVHITVYHPFKIDLGPDISTCPNDSIILVPYHNDSNVTYLWQDNSRKPYYVADTAGLYWVLIKDANQCFYANDQMVYSYLPLPFVQLPPSKTISIYAAPFMLTWGIPSGGTYLGKGVNNGWYNPSVSGIGTHQLKYFLTDSNTCSDTAYMTLTIEDPYLSIGNEKIEEVFWFYPNPSSGLININSSLSGQIQITDVQGKLVYTKNIEVGCMKKLHLNLDHGIYVLMFKSNNYNFTTKLQIFK